MYHLRCASDPDQTRSKAENARRARGEREETDQRGTEDGARTGRSGWRGRSASAIFRPQEGSRGRRGERSKGEGSGDKGMGEKIG